MDRSNNLDLIFFLFPVSVGAGTETATERGGAAVTALTERDAPGVARGRGRAARSANLTATAAAARTGTERRRKTGTESGHRKTKVRTQRCFFFVCVACEVKQLPIKLDVFPSDGCIVLWQTVR